MISSFGAINKNRNIRKMRSFLHANISTKMEIQFLRWHTAHVQMNGSNWFTAHINNTVPNMINMILWVIFFQLKKFLITRYQKKSFWYKSNQKYDENHTAAFHTTTMQGMVPVEALAHVIMSNVTSTDIKLKLRCQIRSMPLMEIKVSHIRISRINLPAFVPRH